MLSNNQTFNFEIFMNEWKKELIESVRIFGNDSFNVLSFIIIEYRVCSNKNNFVKISIYLNKVNS